MAKPQMTGGKCGCPYCTEGVLNPNWHNRKNKRGNAYSHGKSAGEHKAGK